MFRRYVLQPFGDTFIICYQQICWSFFSVFPSVALCGDRVLSTVRNDFPRLSLCTSWRDVWSMMPQRPDIHRRCDIGVFTMSGQERTLRVWTHLVRTEDIEDHHRHEGGFYRRYRYRDLSNMNPLVFQFIMCIYIYVFVLYKILKLTKNLVFFWKPKGVVTGNFTFMIHLFVKSDCIFSFFNLIQKPPGFGGPLSTMTSKWTCHGVSCLHL